MGNFEKVRMGFVATGELHSEIVKEASERGLSKTAVIILALEEYFKNKKEGQKK